MTLSASHTLRLLNAAPFYSTLLLGALLSGALPSGDSAQAAAITFNTALPVGRNHQIARVQYIYDKASSPNLERTANNALGVLAYGVTSRLALFGILPYANKQLQTPAGTREASGFGDARFFARYTLFQQNAPGKTLRFAPFVGVEAPTGKHDEHDDDGLLPPSLQPGSGAWDVFGGIVATYATTRWQNDTQISYRANNVSGAVNGFEAGNVYRADTSLQYRLAQPEFQGPAFLFGVLEANLIYQDRNEKLGIRDPNSGGTTLMLAPGLQYATLRWIAETAVQIPVAQNLNGTALEKDVTVRASVRINF